MFFACYIYSKGVKGGLEKAVKLLIPILFIILIGLVFTFLRYLDIAMYELHVYS